MNYCDNAMSALPQIVIQFDPSDEEIVDREIIRELTQGRRTLEAAAENVKRDQSTVLRRMGAIMTRLLLEKK